MWKAIFALTAIIFFLAGVEWLFFEMPMIILNAHRLVRPLHGVILLGAILTFTYGASGMYLLLSRKTSPKTIQKYYLAGVLGFTFFILIAKVIGKQFLIKI